MLLVASLYVLQVSFCHWDDRIILPSNICKCLSSSTVNFSPPPPPFSDETVLSSIWSLWFWVEVTELFGLDWTSHSVCFGPEVTSCCPGTICLQHTAWKSFSGVSFRWFNFKSQELRTSTYIHQHISIDYPFIWLIIVLELLYFLPHCTFISSNFSWQIIKLY